MSDTHMLKYMSLVQDALETYWKCPSDENSCYVKYCLDMFRKAAIRAAHKEA